MLLLIPREIVMCGFIKQHCSLPVEGNALANQGLYSEAVAQFTKAIELDSSDFRWDALDFCLQAFFVNTF